MLATNAGERKGRIFGTVPFSSDHWLEHSHRGRGGHLKMGGGFWVIAIENPGTRGQPGIPLLQHFLGARSRRSLKDVVFPLPEFQKNNNRNEEKPDGGGRDLEVLQTDYNCTPALEYQRQCGFSKESNTQRSHSSSDHFPSRIRGGNFPTLASRILDYLDLRLLGGKKQRMYPLCCPGVSASKAAFKAGTSCSLLWSSAGTGSGFSLKLTFNLDSSASIAS